MEEQTEYQLYQRLHNFYEEIVMNVVHIYFELEILKKGETFIDFLKLKDHKHTLFHKYLNASICCECPQLPGNTASTRKKKRHLIKHQFNTLYNTSGSADEDHEIKKNKKITQHCLCKVQPRNIEVTELDISLVYVIIKSCSRTPPGSPKWFLSIKNVRNMLTHCGIAKLSKKMFEEQWAILEDNALEIAKVTCQSHYQGLRRRIDDFKERHDIKVCIQAAASNANTEMTQEVLTALQNLSTRLEDETGRIKHKIDKLEFTIKDLQSQFATGTKTDDENQETGISGQSKCYVKWKLSKLNKRREEDIKTKLENVTELSNFSIDSIEKGSVQIQSTVSFEIAHNPEMFAASVLQFLERLAIECKIDTSKDTAIDVEIVLSDVPWSAELNDRPLGMRYDEIRQIVYAYVSHSDKKWTHCTQVLLQNVKLESTKQQQITMRSRKRKSKSKRVSVSERKRSKVLFIESEKGDDSLPSPSDSLYDEKGYTTWAMWSDEDVARKLEDHGLKKAAKIFRVQQLSGEVLDMITEQRLTEYGLKIGGDRLRVLKLIRDWTATQHNTKIFSDPIHGHIEVHPLCIKIIDTPQFQRLRDLKQIGGCYFVYPGASNNRFEHCIGVCYLAGKLARTLQKRQPELDITNKDILCVEIAGLCHDLGHGPFSHLFDEKFIPAVKQKLQWKHANGSVMMFNFLRTNNDLKKEFQKSGFEEKDFDFIVEQIAGPKERQNGEWPYKGREKEKEFLYEIVANKRNGIDVDKWDYFARDCHGLGINNTFDHNRFMKFARVIQVDGSLQICSRDKEAETLYNMFQIRALLHRRAYKHRVCNAVEAMIVDALISADKTKLIPKNDGSLISISDCIDFPEAYTKLTDSIFHVILMSTDQSLAEAREILQRVLHRQLYRCVGETRPRERTKTIEIEKQNEDKIISHIVQNSHDKVKKSDLHIDMVFLDYGNDMNNPINDVSFYKKNNEDEAIKINRDNVSLMLTNVFAEHIIRLYCKTRDTSIHKIASYHFGKWCRSHGYDPQSKISDDMTEH